ncbi:uncharacterized protein QC761_108225 [Podospora bellae-mahoneyi]|uniref:Uncharacterized protein n=1 Tax=Podospora bellae-mahoneyi TaxID=2093777 RepID=A0ABR0FYA4_9PEZI|nr:hypothetical protein QC761_108225 [Podospora bellae-mahoneyi]
MGALTNENNDTKNPARSAREPVTSEIRDGECCGDCRVLEKTLLKASPQAWRRTATPRISHPRIHR